MPPVKSSRLPPVTDPITGKIKPDPTPTATSNGKPSVNTPITAVTPTSTGERPIKYDKVGVRLYANGLVYTVQDAKHDLGWVDEADAGIKYEGDYLLKDANGHKVRCLNNNTTAYTNRPFDEGLAKHWASEILQGHWQLNGESMIIGVTGLCLDIQHRAIGLVLAAQEWAKNPEQWPFWDKEPVIECLIVTGISESPRVVDTINTGKPRSFQDVLSRMPLFELTKDFNSADRRRAIAITDYAMRLVWHRTGAAINAYCPKRSHADALEFIQTHPKIIDCARHICDEDKEGNIRRYLTPGTTAGLMYLMGCCKSDPKAYHEGDANEKALDFTLYEDACDFFANLGANETSLKPVLKYLTELAATQIDGRIPAAERIAILINAWSCVVKQGKVGPATLKLEYAEDDDGNKKLIHPLVGGIDLGPKPDEEEVAAAVDPTEAEIQKSAAQIRDEKAAKKKSKQKLAEIGTDVWVEEDGGVFYGKVMSIKMTPEGKIAEVRDHGAKHKVFEYALADCSTTNPEQEGGE